MTLEMLVILAAGLATWSLRASFITFAGDRELPTLAQRLLDHARPAIFATLLASSLVGLPSYGASAVTPVALGLASAGLAAYRTRSMAWSVAGGVGAYALAEQFVALAPHLAAFAP